MLRILGRPSSINVRKVLWTADEIGVPYAHEAQWATPAAPSGSPELLALNPNGMVPVIEDENGPLWESNTICRYLAARNGRDDLLPTDPVERARVETWMDWQATELNAAWRYAFLALMRKAPGYDDPARIEASLKASAACLDIIDGQLAKTRSFIAGFEFTVADIGLALSIHRIRALPGAARLPSEVAVYFDRLGPRPTFGRWCDPAQP